MAIAEPVLTNIRPELRAEQAIGAFHFWNEAPEYVRQAVEVMGQRRSDFDFFEEVRLDVPRDLAGFTVWAAAPQG